MISNRQIGKTLKKRFYQLKSDKWNLKFNFMDWVSKSKTR